MIQLGWTDFKAAYSTALTAHMAYLDLGDKYLVWFDFHGMMIRCEDLFQDGRDETVDFETNFKSKANKPEAMKVRITNCQQPRKLHDRYVTFTTADDQNFDNTDENGDSYGDITYWMKDSNGDPTSVNANAVQTIIDFFPTWDYEVSGGYLFIPATLTAPKSGWELHIIGAPDIPAAYGGSIAFVANPRISFREGDFFFLDSALNPASIDGSVSAYARKIRWILTHPQGAQCEFQLNMKVFRD